MNSPEEKLDALLREQNHYVDDAGFTARVVKSLPRRRPRLWLRRIFLLGATMAGSILAIFWLPWQNLPSLDLPLHSLNVHILTPWILVLAVVGALIWSTIAAVQSED